MGPFGGQSTWMHWLKNGNVPPQKGRAGNSSLQTSPDPGGPNNSPSLGPLSLVGWLALNEGIERTFPERNPVEKFGLGLGAYYATAGAFQYVSNPAGVLPLWERTTLAIPGYMGFGLSVGIGMDQVGSALHIDSLRAGHLPHTVISMGVPEMISKIPRLSPLVTGVGSGRLAGVGKGFGILGRLLLFQQVIGALEMFEDERTEEKIANAAEFRLYRMVRDQSRYQLAKDYFGEKLASIGMTVFGPLIGAKETELNRQTHGFKFKYTRRDKIRSEFISGAARFGEDLAYALGLALLKSVHHDMQGALNLDEAMKKIILKQDGSVDLGQVKFEWQGAEINWDIVEEEMKKFFQSEKNREGIKSGYALIGLTGHRQRLWKIRDLTEQFSPDGYRCNYAASWKNAWLMLAREVLTDAIIGITEQVMHNRYFYGMATLHSEKDEKGERFFYTDTDSSGWTEEQRRKDNQFFYGTALPPQNEKDIKPDSLYARHSALLVILLLLQQLPDPPVE